VAHSAAPKVVRSYRLVFRRRWRIFRIQNWRIPLPGGLELQLLGYWLCCLTGIGVLARLPLLGAAIAAMPPSLRLLALPIAAAWTLSRWEVDGRAPHRALAGLLLWRLRPRVLAAGRRCPAAGSELAPLNRLVLAPDLHAASYPHGRLAGPARLLLRYPLRAESGRRLWRLRAIDAPALHKGRTLSVPAGRTVSFEAGER
jgi:hypothetical protein